MKRWFPLGLTLFLGLWIAGSLRVPSDKPGSFAVNEFGRLPIVANGRVQPLDSFARNSLLQLREKQRANLEPWKSRGTRTRRCSAAHNGSGHDHEAGGRGYVPSHPNRQS
jgi:hypothetical protein